MADGSAGRVFRRFPFLAEVATLAGFGEDGVSKVSVKDGIEPGMLRAPFRWGPSVVGGRRVRGEALFSVRRAEIAEVVGVGCAPGESVASAVVRSASRLAEPGCVLDADHLVWCPRPLAYVRRGRAVVRGKMVVYVLAPGALREGLARALEGWSRGGPGSCG